MYVSDFQTQCLIQLEGKLHTTKVYIMIMINLHIIRLYMMTTFLYILVTQITLNCNIIKWDSVPDYRF